MIIIFKMFVLVCACCCGSYLNVVFIVCQMAHQPFCNSNITVFNMALEPVLLC